MNAHQTLRSFVDFNKVKGVADLRRPHQSLNQPKSKIVWRPWRKSPGSEPLPFSVLEGKVAEYLCNRMCT